MPSISHKIRELNLRIYTEEQIHEKRMRRLNKDLHRLQKLCKHINVDVGLDLTSMKPLYTCEDCGKSSTEASKFDRSRRRRGVHRR